MNSINQNQPEENFKDLIGQEALDKIKDLAKNAGSCFFCTKIEDGSAFATRPMSPQNIDNDGNFWFLSAADSYKNQQLKTNSAVQMLFGSGYSNFLTLYGSGSISTDKNKITELWNPMLKTWFTEGVNDPRITVIKVTPKEGYYWDTKHGMAVAMIKRMVGAVIGETYDDSIEGTVSP